MSVKDDVVFIVVVVVIILVGGKFFPTQPEFASKDAHTCSCEQKNVWQRLNAHHQEALLDLSRLPSCCRLTSCQPLLLQRDYVIVIGHFSRVSIVVSKLVVK